MIPVVVGSNPISHPKLLASLVLVGVLAAGHGDVVARTAQVCIGPENLATPEAGCFPIDTSFIGGRPFDDYVVTRPGSLFVDAQARRNELAKMSPDTSALYCAASPAARTRPGLPSLTFASSQLVLHTQGTAPTDVSRLRFTGLRTSDGLDVPQLEVALHRERGPDANRLDLLFWADAVGPEVAGLHGSWFRVETTTGTFTHPRWVTMPEQVRRLGLALMDRAPTLLATVSDVLITPGPVNPPWTQAVAIEHATHFRNAVFAPPPQPRFDPIVTLTCSLAGSYQTCAEGPALQAFADYLQQYGADYLESGSVATAAGLLANYRAWAAANALSVIPGIVMGQPNQPDFVPKYTLQQFLMPTITTWSLLRSDPIVPAADRALVDNWIDLVVGYATEPFGGPQNDYMPWNPGYLTLGVRMAWGVLRNNHKTVGEGVERIYMGLHQMRADGSFPREVARGACALSYQVWQTHHLVVLAELAARQGYDAYALSANGKTLHHAIKFILDVVDDPGLIAGYAAMNPTNCNEPPGTPLFVFPIIGYDNGDSPWARIEPYVARFPTHPNAVRLSGLKPGGLLANRPIHHILSGSVTTCFAADRTVAPITPPKTAVEFHHAVFDHHFVTATPAEIDAIDGGHFAGWKRTGESFGVFALGTPGASDVCRFFTVTFAPKSSHFYTPVAEECALVRTNPDWQFEEIVFAMKRPGADGSCAPGTVPLHRLYNDGRSGAPNHRYTTLLATRSEMIARGYTPEGVIGCVPD